MDSAPLRRVPPASVLAAVLLALTACGPAEAESRQAPTAEAPAAAARQSPADSAREALLARADLGRIKGSVQAPVWLVVISDFECPFCKRWHDETAPRLDAAYVRTGKIRVAYLNFPLNTHPNAQPAHEFAMCAAEQGGFWPAADKLFETQALWKRRRDAVAYFDSLGTALRLDMPRLRGCIAEGTLRPLIETDYRRSVRIGVGSTPTFLVGNQAIIGAQPFEAFAAAIDAAIAAQSPNAAR